MRSYRSLTSSIVSFALAVLLVTWALNGLADLLYAIWPLLIGIGIGALILTVSFAFWRHRDYW